MNNVSSSTASILRRIFVSPQGIRAGWSLALFFALYGGLTLGAQLGFAAIPALRSWAASQPRGEINATGQIAYTGLELVILLLSVAVVGRVEGRSFRDYGLARAKTPGRRLLFGLAFGFGLASLLIGLIAILGGYSAAGPAIRGPAVAINALLYGIGFFLVGGFEEFAFRGYLQATLQRTVGFWPAAVVLSLAFGAMHLPNSGCSWTAAALATFFGLVAALSLKRTGTLWFFIGVHAAFDWGNTFFYSSPITGLTARGHLMNATLHGPDWLTGGPAGPVGSALAFVVVALAGTMIHFIFPPTRRPVQSLISAARP